MLGDITIKIKKQAYEALVATISATDEHGKIISRDIDLGGNACSAMYFGANLVVQAIEEILNETIGTNPRISR